ncbi:MAG TPA: menaquinone biosynthesis protein [Geobacterales bacterium]|nr:menaquinone biosynthesis protein [Geobacterales bacterium]
MLRIGQIEYANVTPIFTALRARVPEGEYQFIRGVPAQLNDLLARGELDLSPSSSFEFGRSPQRYKLLSSLSISADGPVKSVLLFSRRPIEELHGATIALTADSATSVALLKILLARHYRFRNTFQVTAEPLDTLMERYPAALLIGDAALKGAAQQRSDLHVYDLGVIWREFTGLPFVFALWIVNRQAVVSHGEEMRLLHQRLLAAKEESLATLPEIAAGCVERSWIGTEELIDYWRTISYDLTDRHLQGVETFFREAVNMGLLPRQPRLELLYP